MTAIFWTARVAMLLFAGRWLVRSERAARWWWTAGAAAFLLHVACAMGIAHGWSHAAALAATRVQTRAVTGWDSGGGLYANYAFAAVWLLDVAAWWGQGLERYARRPRWLAAAANGFLGFMAFHATVTFGHGLTPWVGAAACGAIAVQRWRFWAAAADQPLPSGDRR